MDNNDFPQKRAPMEEHDQNVLKVEMQPAKSLALIGNAISLLWLLLFLLLFQLVWTAIVGAALISIGNWLLERHSTKNIKRDLLEGEKIITLRKIDALEVNPKTGTFYGGSFAVGDRSRHDLYQEGCYAKIGNLWYPVRKEEYEALQGATECEFHISPHSHSFLDCTAVKRTF